ARGGGAPAAGARGGGGCATRTTPMLRIGVDAPFAALLELRGLRPAQASAALQPGPAGSLRSLA
ncbi:hypothetical protein, partial [Streptomyces sp. NPDC050388]|uniref:hypothetical protein n=1 Tax=Streptomyces sp. NPDC050388 TaxID=3155781 RepID=UPI00341BE372